MKILKSITTNGICFALCRNVGVLMEKVQSVLLSAIFKCKQIISLISWSLMMFCVAIGTVWVLVQSITVALVQSQVAGLLAGLVPFYFYFNLSRVVDSECYIYIYTYIIYIYIYHNSSENVFANDLVEMTDCKITPVYAGLRMLKMLYHDHLPTDIEFTCLKKRQLFECVLSSHTLLLAYGV